MSGDPARRWVLRHVRRVKIVPDARRKSTARPVADLPFTARPRRQFDPQGFRDRKNPSAGVAFGRGLIVI